MFRNPIRSDDSYNFMPDSHLTIITFPILVKQILYFNTQFHHGEQIENLKKHRHWKCSSAKKMSVMSRDKWENHCLLRYVS